jgi:hypothetical protein
VLSDEPDAPYLSSVKWLSKNAIWCSKEASGAFVVLVDREK